MNANDVMRVQRTSVPMYDREQAITSICNELVDIGRRIEKLEAQKRKLATDLKGLLIS